MTRLGLDPEWELVEHRGTLGDLRVPAGRASGQDLGCWLLQLPVCEGATAAPLSSSLEGGGRGEAASGSLPPPC